MPQTLVLLVTHNSNAFIPRCVADINAQSLAVSKIVLIDSGSKETEYLKGLPQPVHTVFEKNVGFCVANNLAVTTGGMDFDYYFMVNPDAFIAPDWVEKAVSIMEKHPELGALSSPLKGYDITQNAPRETYDSTGVYRSKFGRWYDRHQGQKIAATTLEKSLYFPDALCGALILLRGNAVRALWQQDGFLLDPRLFMYKDDIDLSLRLKKNGWKIAIEPTLQAFHCRGWQPQRTAVPRWARLLSAKNEVCVGWKFKSLYLPVYLLKYLYVRFFEK
jgi:N-acetylglucosaminyl-diphospho-decaprenol L-rhamnosyltransferase